MPIRLVLVLIWALTAPVAAAAQEAWLQIAAERGEPRARAVAERFAGALPDLALIETGSWIAVAAGPFPQEEAERLWRELRAAGTIPADSYLSDGQRYGAVLARIGPPQPPRVLWRRAGIAVSADGAVLSLAEGLGTCRRIVLAEGRAARLAAEDGRLALLLPEDPGGVQLPARLAARPALPGAALVLGGAAASPGEIGLDGRISVAEAGAPPEPGAPVLTETGDLAGMVPAGARARMLPAADLGAFLADAGVLLAQAPGAAPALPPEIRAQRAGLVSAVVTCWS